MKQCHSVLSVREIDSWLPRTAADIMWLLACVRKLTKPLGIVSADVLQSCMPTNLESGQHRSTHSRHQFSTVENRNTTATRCKAAV